MFTIDLLVFPKVQQLDPTGRYEAFASIPGAEVRLIWKDLDPIVSAAGLVLIPDTRMTEVPQHYVLCVPGGAGMNALMEDEDVLAFLRRQSEGARFVSSVCSGALVLAGAGLLAGKRAEAIQLFLEYAPASPFAAGLPETAPPEVLARVRAANDPARRAREEVVRRIEARRAS